MTVVIDTVSTTFFTFNTDELHIVTQNAVIATDASDGIGFGFGTGGVRVSGQLVVAGTVSSETYAAVQTNGLDHVTVSQTGQLYGFGLFGTGLGLGYGGNSGVVAGLAYGNHAGVAMTSSNGNASELTIASTGIVQGGRGVGQTNGNSAAISVSMDAATSGTFIVNHGLIHADVNEFDGARTAIRVAASSVQRLTLDNTGTIYGDIQLQAGIEVINNSGLIDGNVRFGANIDVYDGRGGLTTGTVYGEDGTDRLYGGEDRDILFGGDDDDDIFGFGGADLLSGDDGGDDIRGGGGEDVIYGGSNNDTIRGGSSDDLIYGDDGADTLYGNSGDDTIYGGTEDDLIEGGSGKDLIEGGSENDEIEGGAGNDFIRGNSGNDDLGGGAGNDAMSGGSGNDTMDGGSGSDRMFGSSGNDTLKGTLGNDYLNGGSGDDSMSGGSDNDTLIGGTGQDIMSGGWGADVFDFNAILDSRSGVATRDSITDFQTGLDMIDLSDISGTLTFVNSFTGVAGQVRYNDAVGRLYIDSDGDMGSDFQVDLGAGAGLMADDLIL